MIGKDKGNRKRKKLGRKAEDQKRTMSVSGVPPLKMLENSEDVKVGFRELIMQISEQARKEGGKKLFQIFRQGEKEMYIASLARWDTQAKGLVEMERRCQDLMQEVEL